MSKAAVALYKALHKKRAYTKLYWDVANAIGINEALLIEVVERWCELNQERGKSNYFQQGEWWTSATYQEWAERYPALGGWKSIQRIFLGLEKENYILSGKFTKGSQAKYYRVNPEAIGILLLTGTLKEEIGIVSNSDSTISKMDGIVSNSDGTVSDLDVHPYIDQIIQRNHSIKSPLAPHLGGEETKPACGAVGSLGASTPTLQTEEVKPQPQNKLALEEKDKHSSSESNEAITGCDNNSVSTQSSAYRMEQQLKSRTNYKLPAYRIGEGRNGIKKDFLEWLQSNYLPTTPHYKGKKVEILDAKNWVSNKEKSGDREEIEERYEQMVAKQANWQQTKEPEQSPFTEEQEAWVAIVKEIQIVSEGGYVNIAPHGEFWQLTSNINGFSGWLHTVMANIPLSSLPTRLKVWYPECYCNALKKFPHLSFPAPLPPMNRVG